ncbi:MAG: uroporphyrinogen decarboxylase family protein [Caldilinea sp.]|uniref:uroporphyrinogen decarboxylase family protein n=1 Tax=Caldilinea sp. TaxID=2293560 RepID=UPI002CD499A1|nr:uroporphyrinogen decarboxylase family protein [Caldilinea sp.]
MTTTMTSKQRMLTALQRGAPDRLPVTTHHLMHYFLETYLDGASEQAFFDHFGLDAITWVVPHRPDPTAGEFYDPQHTTPGFLESRRIASSDWRVEVEDLPDPRYRTTRYHFVTPKGALTMTAQSNEHTTWLSEHLIKEKGDIDLIGEFVTAPKCDVEAVNCVAEAFGERGLVRGHICCFDVFGQPGTWQDACCLVGTQRMIMETFDDPAWVHTLLQMLHRRKRIFVESLQGARYDLLELGGGDASTTVISPTIFENFVAPYDADLIAAAHAAGQRIVYHTCGGMMPILETIAAMQPDAMETFTPKQMGGDVRLAEAKRRIGDKVCMIGGFDQFHHFTKCSEAETRAAVRRAFADAGEGGGFILSPSDHFFDAEPTLIAAFADEARQCVYAST